MSLILQGINLPTEGEDITLEINHKGEVRAYSTVPMVYDYDIQAIQIPKDHGRLIDGDKFKETMGDTNMDIYTDEVKEHIDDAPTILEAEE